MRCTRAARRRNVKTDWFLRARKIAWLRNLRRDRYLPSSDHADLAGRSHRVVHQTRFDGVESHRLFTPEGDQAVVTTIAQHADVPPRRYPWGRPESKYIESPASSACSWPSM